jgi:hypothetical protein
LEKSDPGITAWRLAPEVHVMLHPTTAWQRLLQSPEKAGAWQAVRRPLFFAFLLGCMVSLVASRELTLRHIVGGTISGCIIVLGQILAFAVVCRRGGTTSFTQALDLFFMGYGPWPLWILCFSAVWAFASPVTAFVWAGQRAILISALVPALWCGYIDFCFMKSVLYRSSGRAAWDLFLQRAISWTISIMIFGAGAVVPEAVRIFSR